MEVVCVEGGRAPGRVAGGLRELRQHPPDHAVGGVLHDPLARLDVQELQQHQRAQRHGNQLRGHFIF